MSYLGNPAGTLEIVRKYHLNIQKKFGQNFLIDDEVLTQIVDAAEISPNDCVLEIGPGIGTMTQYLAEKAREVVAVEIDKALIPVLQDTLAVYNNVTVINKDILKVSIPQIVAEKNQGNPVKVVANLPYYITTPIIMKLFESNMPLLSVTVMVQKEVADRMQMGPGSREYGALSLAVQYYSKPEIIAKVPPSSFIPQPGVESAVIRLTRYQKPPVEVQDELHMFEVIKAAFAQRRKTLANAVSHMPTLQVEREQVVQALAQLSLSADVRGEALSLEQFAALSDILLLKKRK